MAVCGGGGGAGMRGAAAGHWEGPCGTEQLGSFVWAVLQCTVTAALVTSVKRAAVSFVFGHI